MLFATRETDGDCMDRSYRILPTYTGDVSGACSALFELGGMVVIHDPSGCNSTYNTHDETRWYDKDSLVFITGLVERDAILGNDQKLVNDVVDAALELGPRFIALCNSPIPFISGTDFRALCKIIERKTGIPTFYVSTNGMHDYVVGAGNAFAQVAQRFVCNGTPRSHALNILGATPLDFCDEASVQGLRDFASGAGYDVVSCWAMGSSLDELVLSAQASVNLVVSSTGLKAARVLRERFGTPYVAGTPIGTFSQVLEAALSETEQTGACAWPCCDAREPAAEGSGCVVGEPVAAGSVAAALQHDMGSLRVVCPLECEPELLAGWDVRTSGEDAIECALAQSTLVVADKFYEPACPPDAQLCVWPHFALSGRQCFAQERDHRLS